MFATRGGQAGGGEMGHCDFYPQKLADVKKFLRNQTMEETQAARSRRRTMIWVCLVILFTYPRVSEGCPCVGNADTLRHDSRAPQRLPKLPARVSDWAG